MVFIKSLLNGVQFQDYQLEGSLNKKNLKINSITSDRCGVYQITVNNNSGSDYALWTVMHDSNHFLIFNLTINTHNLSYASYF